MASTQIHDEIAAERLELAAILRSLPAEAWDAPTLCAGWRPKEVVAHITMPYRYSSRRFFANLIRARGNFNRMSDRCARRDAAELSPDDLVTVLEHNANHRWKPPGGGFEGALAHDVIHGLDITVALGIDRRVPENRIQLVLKGADSPRSLKYFGVDLEGIELRADDIDWSLGSGEPLCGMAQDLLLVLSGRKLPPGRLRGAAQDRFTGSLPRLG